MSAPATLPTSFSTAPLSEHLHGEALTVKRELASFIQELTIKHHGQASLKLQLDSHNWTPVPGTTISVRHIERHPDDPDNAAILASQDKPGSCPDVLPHISMFAVPRGARGTMVSMYNARLTLVSGAMVVNGVLVTAHDRSRAEYRATADQRIEFEALEMCYAQVKYFADMDQVPLSEAGPDLGELLARQGGRDWFTIYADGVAIPSTSNASTVYPADNLGSEAAAN